VPVLTGLGHEIDQAIADRTAHSAFKTPTKVAEFLVEAVGHADRSLDELGRRLGRTGMELLRQGREMLGRSERGLALARHRVAAGRADLAHLARRFAPAVRILLDSRRHRLAALPRRLAGAAPLTLERWRRRPDHLTERLAARSQLRLREWAVQIEGWDRLCRDLAPDRTLERGFSITRDSAGRPLVSPEGVAAGERIITQLAGGRLTSRVEES
jgi:exodeoxyribonuclease VII large subunit